MKYYVTLYWQAILAVSQLPVVWFMDILSPHWLLKALNLKNLKMRSTCIAEAPVGSTLDLIPVSYYILSDDFSKWRHSFRKKKIYKYRRK